MTKRPLHLLSAGILAGSALLFHPQSTLHAADANPIPVAQADGLGPVESIAFLAENLANKRADAFWVMLPASYREQITALVHGFADEVDADVYQQAADLLKKLVRVLHEKKDFILNSPMLAEMLDQEQQEVEAGYTAVVTMLGILVNSELGDLERLKTVDLGAMLAETGGRMMTEVEKAAVLVGADDPFIQFRNPTIELVSEDGDNATVRVTSTEMEDGVAIESVTEMNLTKVEGRWIEADMAESFGEGMKEAQAALGEMDWKDGKMAALTVISGIDSTLDELLAANTPEEFNAATMQLFGGLMGGVEDFE